MTDDSSRVIHYDSSKMRQSSHTIPPLGGRMTASESALCVKMTQNRDLSLIRAYFVRPAVRTVQSER